jgi:hypothetical protein
MALADILAGLELEVEEAVVNLIDNPVPSSLFQSTSTSSKNLLGLTPKDRKLS